VVCFRRSLCRKLLIWSWNFFIKSKSNLIYFSHIVQGYSKWFIRFKMNIIPYLSTVY
jgi:hypothetical protein